MTSAWRLRWPSYESQLSVRGIATELKALGVPVDSPVRLDELAAAFLGSACDQVTQTTQIELSSLLDLPYLGES
jgi:hypothetical protein